MVLYILDLVAFEKSKYGTGLPQNKVNHMAGQYLLEYALGKEVYNQSHFVVGVHGKPYIADCSIHYNISHSGRYAVLVVADSEVGVDVQEKRVARMDALVKRYFAEEERKRFEDCRNHAEKKDLFYFIWCRKEAYGKYLGVGLTRDVFSTNVLHDSCDADCQFFDCDVLEGYQISICSRKEEHLEKIVSVFEGL